MQHIAIFDLGSNSARLAVFRLSPQGEFSLCRRAFEMVRLAASLQADGTLAEEAFTRTADALLRLKQIAAEYQCTGFLCIATEAARRAKNGERFLTFIKEETQLDFTVISGEAEAQYGFLAVREGLSLSDFVLLDTGGASAEISIVRNGALCRSVSLPIGSLVMHRRFLHTDPASPEEIAALTSFLKETIGGLSWLSEGRWLPLAALGGTNKCLAKLDSPGRDSYQRYELTYARISELYETLKASSVSERGAMPGMEQGREDTILSGTAVLTVLMELLSAPRMMISEWGLEYGVFLEYCSKAGRKI